MRIGVDLGGTKIESAALSPAGDVLERLRSATPRGGYDSVVRGIAALVATIETRELLTDAQKLQIDAWAHEND